MSLLEELEGYATVLPAVNEIEMHPKYQNTNTLNFCKTRGIAVIAYGNGIALRDPDVVPGSKATGTNPSQILLKWALHKGVSVIPKSTNVTRQMENLQAINLTVSKEDLSRLDQLDTHAPFYWDMNVLGHDAGNDAGYGGRGPSLESQANYEL